MEVQTGGNLTVSTKLLNVHIPWSDWLIILVSILHKYWHQCAKTYAETCMAVKTRVSLKVYHLRWVKCIFIFSNYGKLYRQLKEYMICQCTGMEGFYYISSSEEHVAEQGIEFVCQRKCRGYEEIVNSN